MPDLHVGVTGHRHNSLESLAAYERGLRMFFSEHKPAMVYLGMALGVDQLAADIVLDMRLPFTAVVPFPSQAEPWPIPCQQRYRRLLSQAHEVVMVSRRDPVDKRQAVEMLLARNRIIVERSDVIIACWSGVRSGGTWHTMRLARFAGKQVFVISHLGGDRGNGSASESRRKPRSAPTELLDWKVNHPALTGGACGTFPQAQVDQGARLKRCVGAEQKRFR